VCAGVEQDRTRQRRCPGCGVAPAPARWPLAATVLSPSRGATARGAGHLRTRVIRWRPAACCSTLSSRLAPDRARRCVARTAEPEPGAGGRRFCDGTACRYRRRVTLDLRGLDFLNSSGLDLRHQARCAGARGRPQPDRRPSCSAAPAVLPHGRRRGPSRVRRRFGGCERAGHMLIAPRPPDETRQCV
jgi:hypothetical protein